MGWRDPDGTRTGAEPGRELPGVANAWPYPIENRLNMLSTGIKTPVGIKIMGPDLRCSATSPSSAARRCGRSRARISAYPERTFGGYYLDFDIDREAARYGLTTGDVQDVIQSAVGGHERHDDRRRSGALPAQRPLRARAARRLPAPEAGARRHADGRADPAGQLATITINPARR
jgi:hypothetical protein